MKTLNTFLSLCLLSLLSVSVTMAQPARPDRGPGQTGRSFVDADGNGMNDLAPDDDGDGIPNGLDPDHIVRKGKTKGNAVKAHATGQGRSTDKALNQRGENGLESGKKVRGQKGQHGRKARMGQKGQKKHAQRLNDTGPGVGKAVVRGVGHPGGRADGNGNTARSDSASRVRGMKSSN